MTKSTDPDIADSSGLTDADWAEINKLKRAYEAGGNKALDHALKELAEDPVRYIRVIGAHFPDDVREAIRDAMAERGMTEEDLREIVRKHENSERKQ